MKKILTRAVTAACAAILCISTVFAPVHAGSPADEEADIVVTDSPEVSFYMNASDAPDISDAPEIVDAPDMSDYSEAAETPEFFRDAKKDETIEVPVDPTDDGVSSEDGLSGIPDEEHDAEGSELTEIMTGASDTTWTVGDNVTAEISSKNLYFSSTNEGQLYEDWKEIIGDAVLTVENVSVSSGKIYLPEDSSFLYENMTGIKSINTSGMDTSHVTDMAGMFAELSVLKRLDLSGFSTSKVTDMYQMFYGCSALTELNLTGLSTSKVTDMEGMFSGCESLARLDLSGFNTSNVGDMSSMFSGCGNLTELDLKNFDTTKASTEDMFLGCSGLAKLVTPKINSSSVKLPKTMYDKSGKSYTSLPNLTASITLTASKPAVTPTPVPTKYAFSDVQNPKHAYFNAIYWAADAGITKGYPDGTFGINRSCTRGEMMMFLWRYARKPAPKTVSKSPFKDVPKSHTFYKAILWGSQKGITKGYSDGTFGINKNVSRGECMMFLWRLKGKPTPKAVAKSPFKDVPKSHVFYNAILWGAQKKITTGYTSGEKKGMFDIDANCSRGQIVTFLYRAR